MHVLTLFHRIMGKCQISYGDIEIAELRLGQTRNIFMLENVFFFYHALPEINQKNQSSIIMSILRKNLLKSDWYINPAIPPPRGLVWPQCLSP